MARCVFWFNDSDNYVNLEAEEFHEEGEYLKAYQRNELVGIFQTSIIKAAYRTDKNERG